MKSLRELKPVEELKELLIDYAPNKQIAICKDEELCYFGESPTLAELNNNYDSEAANAFLIPQLTNIAEFSGCKNIMSSELINECAEMIVAEYYYLKITEVMLFCYKFKRGDYGQFYGSVSPMVILSSLRLFLNSRAYAYFKHDNRLREAKIQKMKRDSTSYDEHLKRKNKV